MPNDIDMTCLPIPVPVGTLEEYTERSCRLMESAECDMERLGEQCCDEFHGEIGVFQKFPDDRAKWRSFARYLWGLGARPARGGGYTMNAAVYFSRICCCSD